MDRYDPYTDKFLRDTQYDILSTNLAEVGTDCISKQQAIKTVGWYSCHSGDELLFADNALRQLPPIQPKRGEWNRLGRDTFNCNKCGATFVLNQGSEKMHFCPNCGADMRGEQNG